MAATTRALQMTTRTPHISLSHRGSKTGLLDHQGLLTSLFLAPFFAFFYVLCIPRVLWTWWRKIVVERNMAQMVNSDLKPPIATKAYPSSACHAPPLYPPPSWSHFLPTLVRAQVDNEQGTRSRTELLHAVGTELCSRITVREYWITFTIRNTGAQFYTMIAHSHTTLVYIPLCRCRCRCRRRRMHVCMSIGLYACSLQPATCTPRTLALPYMLYLPCLALPRLTLFRSRYQDRSTSSGIKHLQSQHNPKP